MDEPAIGCIALHIMFLANSSLVPTFPYMLKRVEHQDTKWINVIMYVMQYYV